MELLINDEISNYNGDNEDNEFQIEDGKLQIIAIEQLNKTLKTPNHLKTIDNTNLDHNLTAEKIRLINSAERVFDKKVMICKEDLEEQAVRETPAMIYNSEDISLREAGPIVKSNNLPATIQSTSNKCLSELEHVTTTALVSKLNHKNKDLSTLDIQNEKANSKTKKKVISKVNGVRCLRDCCIKKQ